MERLKSCLWALALAAVACSKPAGPTQYPRYTPAEAALFDNSVDPAALTDADAPRDRDWDAKLIERAQRADAVYRATIVTVERHTEGGYSIEARVVGVLSGRRPEGNVQLALQAGSDMARRLDHGARLIGRHVVLFVRRHADEAGPVTHFRAEPDRDEVVEVVRRAANALDGDG
jgi:hypothetical protein